MFDANPETAPRKAGDTPRDCGRVFIANIALFELIYNRKKIRTLDRYDNLR